MAVGLDGVIESFTHDEISGWAAARMGDRFGPAHVRLHFRDFPALDPSEYRSREGGRTGFVFHMPDHLKQLTWRQLIDKFDAVIARPAPALGWDEELRLPLYKSVLAQREGENVTTIRSERLKEYKRAPVAGGRIAAYTIVYNEHLMLPLWARYFAECLGEENIYVIDRRSSEQKYNEILPHGVDLVRIPRDNFDNWLIERTVASFQRFLLEYYDSVIYTDSDEFLCVDPSVAKGASFREFMLNLSEPIGISTGYNLVHELESEVPYDPTRSLLSQRRYIHRMHTMDKPVVSRVPLNWVPGFHSAREGGRKIAGLYLLHLRWFDRDYALKKGAGYRDSKWDQHDIEAHLGEYQREAVEQIEARLCGLAADVRAVSDANFDPAALYTVVPRWMREVIFI